jgi:hypothetical protein
VPYILSTTDTEGIPVLLGEDEWENHILERHPEIPPFIDEIKLTIENPDIRQIDPEDDRVYLNYREIPVKEQLHPKLRYLLVVVKYVYAPERDFQKTGFISSVYFVREPKKRRQEPWLMS